ncbi:MAG TPA: adenylate kinase [Vicinamibacterales bacterium]|jgi:adenylate kinase|nr:adenylate kinase [Vicinamibacterales bacterium]
MALSVIMMGPPGAGKGTQAEHFARERNLLKVSTGDILREAIKAETALGRAAKATMEQGKLVDDPTMIGIVRERLMKPDAMRGFVLDGFPRTVAQARALDQIITERDGGPLIVVDIVVPERDLVRRLAGRRICSSCGANADPFESSESADRCKRCGGQFVQRTDDSEEVVLRRLKVYERDTRPLVDYYRDRPTFRIVNGAQVPERVAHELAAVIDSAAAASEPRRAPRLPRMDNRVEPTL